MKGFREKERRTSFSFQRQVSLNTSKDLVGMIFDDVMKEIIDQNNLKGFRYMFSKYKAVIVFAFVFCQLLLYLSNSNKYPPI